MTKFKRSEVECPTWEEDVNAAQDHEFAVAVRSAILLVDRSASRSLLTTEMVCLWHRVLFRAFVPLDYYAGSFRQDETLRPCLGQDVEVNGVQGTPFRKVVYSVEKLIAESRVSVARTELHWTYLNPGDRARRVSLIVARLIGTFIRIHPFLNGNGRTSRLIWRWALQRFGFDPQTRIAPRPGGPYGNLMECCMRGNDAPLALAVLQRLADP